MTWKVWEILKFAHLLGLEAVILDARHVTLSVPQRHVWTYDHSYPGSLGRVELRQILCSKQGLDHQLLDFPASFMGMEELCPEVTNKSNQTSLRLLPVLSSVFGGLTKPKQVLTALARAVEVISCFKYVQRIFQDVSTTLVPQSRQ